MRFYGVDPRQWMTCLVQQDVEYGLPLPRPAGRPEVCCLVCGRTRLDHTTLQTEAHCNLIMEVALREDGGG